MCVGIGDDGAYAKYKLGSDSPVCRGFLRTGIRNENGVFWFQFKINFLLTPQQQIKNLIEHNCVTEFKHIIIRLWEAAKLSFYQII